MSLCMCVRIDMSRYMNNANVGGSGGGAEEHTGTTEEKYYSSECGGACSTCEVEEKFYRILYSGDRASRYNSNK
jgi:hypothetical protein